MTESVALNPRFGSGARAGTVIGETYRLSRKLGGGAMGEVYEAEHLRLPRRVAVKVLRADSMDNQRAVRRFQGETLALATLRSDHIVAVLDCGELEDGTPYTVMERLEGEDLRRLLERATPLSPRRAVHLALDVCRGLSVVHAAGIVHRDLKPANLFVAKGNCGEDVCKILDFGVAKLVGSDATHEGALLGTVRYMAPEQIRSGKEVGPAADLYAVGAILYECIAGVPARTSESREELMFEILSRPPTPIAEHCPMVPSQLESLVIKALASDPSERFESADAMAQALEAVLAGVAVVDSTEPEGPPTKAPAPDQSESLRSISEESGATESSLDTSMYDIPRAPGGPRAGTSKKWTSTATFAVVAAIASAGLMMALKLSRGASAPPARAELPNPSVPKEAAQPASAESAPNALPPRAVPSAQQASPLPVSSAASVDRGRTTRTSKSAAASKKSALAAEPSTPVAVSPSVSPAPSADSHRRDPLADPD